MQTNQRGSASNWLLFVVLVCALWAWAYTGSPASPDAVKEVVTKAQSSPAATAILKASLAATPTPTVSQLAEIRRKVEEELVLEHAKAVTGDLSLQSASIAKAQREKEAEEAVVRMVFDGPMKWVLAAALVLLALLGLIKFYQHGTRA